MTELKKEYKNFLDDIEKNIKNKEDLEYIKERFSSFIDIMFNKIDDILNCKEEKISMLEKSQKDLENKVKKVEKVIENIEKDIYSEEGFDFEIVCPYCDNEFIIDMDEEKTEVECPECKNQIELDWSGDSEEDGCQGNCSHCSGCEENNLDSDEDDDDDM